MGCCLCTETQQQTYRPILNLQTSTRLQYLESDKCDCLYGCGGDQYIYYFHLSNPVSIEIFDSLFERGFVRNSLYFRKYDLQSCCIGYNTRINVLNHNLNPKQQKIVTKLTNKDFPQLGGIQIKDFKKEEIDRQENQVSKDMKTYQKPLEHDEIKYEKDQVLIEKCVSDILQMLENDIIEINGQLSLQHFTSKLSKQENLKIFYNKKLQTYFSNLNLLLYEQNKELGNLNQEKINTILGKLYNDKIFQNKYKIFQGQSGYLTFIDLENIDVKKIQHLEKNKNKKKQSKEKKKKHSYNSETKAHQNTDNNLGLKINDLTNFSLGYVQISIQDPYFQGEVYKLYKKYMKEIHGSDVYEESFQKFYSTNITSQDSYKTNQNNASQLHLGQKFMMYRLNGKLIGCGVILILSNILISEYLFYDPILKPYSFGIFAAFAEIEYVRAINKTFPDFKYHSLSYVILKNQSMNYKLQFSGLEIQCPTTYKWIKYDQKIKSLMIANCSKLSQENQENKQQIYLNDCKVKIVEEIISVSQLELNIKQYVIGILNQNENILGEHLMKQIIFNID